MDNNLIRVALAVIAIVLCSCSEFDRDEEYYITPELQPYVEAFYAEAELRGVFPRRDNLSVRVNDIDGLIEVSADSKIMGLTIKHRNVLVDDEFYNANAEGYSLNLESVVFHELGHALLLREHIDSEESLMNAYFCIHCYKKDRETFLDELFNFKE